MKKFFAFVFALLILVSCSGGVDFRIPVEVGDTRVTETKEYIIVEVCESINGFGHPWWKKISVERKQIPALPGEQLNATREKYGITRRSDEGHK